MRRQRRIVMINILLYMFSIVCLDDNANRPILTNDSIQFLYCPQIITSIPIQCIYDDTSVINVRPYPDTVMMINITDSIYLNKIKLLALGRCLVL